MSTTKSSDNERITFRIESETLNVLKQLADEEGISTNTLVNIILRSYVDWEQLALGAGFAVFQKEMVKEMIASLDQGSIEQIAIKTATAYAEALLLLKGKVDLDSFIKVLRERAKRAGFAYREFEDSTEKRIVIYHDMGYKWSSYLKVHTEQVINKMGYGIQYATTENSLVIKLPVLEK